MKKTVWLKREMEAAAAEVERWPAWMRDADEKSEKVAPKQQGNGETTKKKSKV